MKRAAVVIALCAALASPLWGHEEETAMEELVPVLSVQGSGQARVEPDEATVRLGVTAQATTAREAQEQVNRTANAIMEAVRRLGVQPQQVQTSELFLGPIYGQNRPEVQAEPRITGYQASNVVSVSLEKLDQVGPVIDAGLGAGANRLDGVVFGLRNDAAARAQALTAAVTEARGKAQALASAAGVRLAELVEVTEGGVSFTPVYQKGRVAMAAEAMDMSTPVASGQVSVDASVTLRYRIAPQGAPR
jgi:uncharacterized protein YggE